MCGGGGGIADTGYMSSSPSTNDREREWLARIDRLEAQLSQALARITELEAQLARARKNSSNSSKPPSSDIVKPPKPKSKRGRKRKRGGQPGHSRHERAAFAQDEIDAAYDYVYESCPDCGGVLKKASVSPRVVQQVELIGRPIRIEEHRAHSHWCPHCRRTHEAPLPPEVKAAGLAGPRLTALTAYLKGACHASYSTVEKFLREVVGVELSRGQLVKLIRKTSRSLDAAYEQLLATLPSESHLNVDETGHKECRKKYWTWCFRAALYTLFKIDKSRGSQVLLDVLGREFDGVIGCDYFSAYRKYMGEIGADVQFCLAHLIRDVKFLTESADTVTANYGRRLLDALREMFRVIHRRDSLSPERFARKLHAAKDRVIAKAKSAPPRNGPQNLADRFRKHGDAYFTFITAPGVEPTNNLAEQAIRFVVIDRRITQGTRSEIGRRWCERIWTTIATCAQQGRSVFRFLCDAIHAHFAGTPAPPLLLQIA